MQKINAGIIGLGGFSTLITAALDTSDRVRILAGADIDSERLKQFRERSGIMKTYNSAEALIQDSDLHLVIIATPPSTHFPLGEKAIAAGKHVFFEKPGL